MAETLVVTSSEAARRGLAVNQDGVRRTAFELLGHPDLGCEAVLAAFPALAAVRPEILAQVERDARYAPYLARQAQDIARLQRDEGVALPAALDYARIGGLSGELRGKLERVRPESLGQAARIEGMTPVALTQILLRVRQEQAARGVMIADGPEAVRAAFDVSRETMARWRRIWRCCGNGTRGSTWCRAPASTRPGPGTSPNSAQLWALRPPGARLWLDLGSGAGLPGLVIAAMAAEAAPGARGAAGRERSAQGCVPARGGRAAGLPAWCLPSGSRRCRRRPRTWSRRGRSRR